MNTNTKRSGPFALLCRILLLAYVAAVIVSRVWIMVAPEPPRKARSGESVLRVAEIVGDRNTGRPVQLAYYDSHSEVTQQHPERPAVLLVHGSPGSGSNFRRVIPEMSPDYRVIAPDLPGFAGSEPHIADYSFRAHAHYLLEMMDQLGIQKAHLIGFSMGGGVVLEMQRIAPQRVASITMLSGLGVQECELTGDYWLNHIVHGFQHVAFWALDILIPHFGKLDLSFVHSYTRNFYDSDQRPLRAVLQNYNGPMLIIHGKHDENVPYEAALEHYRLVPQSEMQNPGDNHFMVFEEGPRLAGILNNFIQKADAGKATTRATADAQRVAESLQPFNPANKPPLTGVGALAAFILFALATLINEEASTFYAGFLSGAGRVSLGWALAGCFVGIFLFGILIYMLGRLIRGLGRQDAGAASASGAGSRWTIGRTRWTPFTRVRDYLKFGQTPLGWWRFVAWHLLFSAAAVLVLGGVGALAGVWVGH